MGFRFSRRVTVFPGVKLNISRSGISTSVGVRGASVTVGRQGPTMNVGIPGTGIAYRQKIGTGRRSSGTSSPALMTGDVAPRTGRWLLWVVFWGAVWALAVAGLPYVSVALVMLVGARWLAGRIVDGPGSRGKPS